MSTPELPNKTSQANTCPQIKIEVKKNDQVVYVCTLPLEWDHISFDVDLPPILKKQAI